MPKYLSFSHTVVLMTLMPMMAMAETTNDTTTPNARLPMQPVLSAGDIVVTTTGEAQDKQKVPESVSVLTKEQLTMTNPAHPSEALNKIAGVHVNNLGGEGHMTSIRQPISTGGSYLFLEDGLPTRPAGFFNHNGLYEINIPQSGSLEVTKGPGSALYGSEAVGGIINSVTEASPEKFELMLNPEVGSFGWKRGLMSVGDYSKSLQSGFRLNVNVTDNEGYQEDAGYERQSVTLRTDTAFNDSLTMKNIISYTDVFQSGVSSLTTDEYYNNPRNNRYSGGIATRDVYALRISSELEYEPDAYNLFTVTPFYRDNEMILMPSWQLAYQPEIYTTAFQSYGVQTKYRRNIPSMNAKIITGVDVDYTPSQNTADDITAIPDAAGNYRNYTLGSRVYDFNADQLAISPYLHTDIEVLKDLTLSAGVRYDYFKVDYTDNLPDSFSERQFNAGLGRPITRLRPDSQSVSYDEISPKLGLSYGITPNHNIYGNYRHSLRVPSAGSLFRSGSSSDTDKLEPTKVDSFEIGAKGKIASWLGYDVALYHMIITNDVVSYLDNGDRKVKNAGETTHDGIEIALHGDITDQLYYSTGFSYTKQQYEDFNYRCGIANCNYSGFDVAKAPKTLGNITIGYKPSFVPDLTLEAEMLHVGSYFTDETNVVKYDGYNLFNLRANYDINEKISLYGRVMNVTDRRYSSLVSTAITNFGTDTSYNAGLPLSFFGGLKFKL